MSDIQLSGHHSSGNNWCLNLLKSSTLLFISTWLLIPGLWSAGVKWPYPYHSFYSDIINTLGLYPPDSLDQFMKINLNLTTDNYKVTYDETSRWIYLDPLGKHETTVIFLHGIWSRGDKYFHVVAD